MTNEISGRSRRVLDFLLNRSISENSPFKAKVLILNFYAYVRYFAGPSGRAVYGPLPAEIVGSYPTA